MQWPGTQDQKKPLKFFGTGEVIDKQKGKTLSPLKQNN